MPPARRLDYQKSYQKQYRKNSRDKVKGVKSCFELDENGDVLFEEGNKRLGVWKGTFFFLTFPKSGLEVDFVKTYFHVSEGVIELEVVKELHEDGSPHLHVLLHYGKQVEMTRGRASCGGEVPNIKSVPRGDVHRVRAYIKKSPVNFRSTWLKSKDSGWTKVLDMPSIDEAIELAQGLQPRDYVLFRPQMEIGLAAHFKKKNPIVWTSRYLEDQFRVSEQMRLWLNGMRRSDEVGRKRSLILIGPSRVGKTEWARCLGSHFYMNGSWNLGCFREDVEYGIFDDLEFGMFKYFKQFMGCQQSEFSVSDKFIRNSVIRFGKPCIWLCNEDIDSWKMSSRMYDWVSRNCDIVYVDEYIY